MTALDFIDRHPWWSLFVVIILAATTESIFEIVTRRGAR